ncbi:MAG: hypothetical protein FJ387_29960 [Verrucomicrobia bacterium]|nr:hypothetical protein [Verrucomicrobiota bacterium]
MALTNNLFARVYGSIGNGANALSCYARNNLFWRGQWNLNAATSNDWEWRDNLFDQSAVWCNYGGIANSKNAYVSCPNQILPVSGDNILLSSFTYVPGPLEPYYQPPSSPLINAGSRSAAAAGLYHYTVNNDLGTPLEVFRGL